MMGIKMIKFKTRNINITKNPIFIIGQCPGNQRKADSNKQVFHANRTGDFIEKIIKNKKNIYLTNLFNYLIDGDITDEIIKKGLSELIKDIKKYKPRKLIVLGNIAFNAINKSTSAYTTLPITSMRHPSFILRFNKDKRWYKTRLLKEIGN